MITASNLDPKGNRFWKVITEPTVEPITVTEVKEYARIDGSDEDSFLESAITSVRLATEEYLGRALIQQTIRLVMDEYNERDLPLPRPPLISISSIQTIDEDDTTTDFDSDKYYAIVEAIPGRVVIKNTKSLPSNTTRVLRWVSCVFLSWLWNHSQHSPTSNSGCYENVDHKLL